MRRNKFQISSPKIKGRLLFQSGHFHLKGLSGWLGKYSGRGSRGIQILKSIFFVVISLFLFASCGILRHGKTKGLTDGQKLENTAEYIDGCNDKIAGEYEKAIVHFISCAKVDESNPAPLYEIAQIYYYLNKTESAKPYIEQACVLDKENQWYQLLHAELLVAEKNYKSAATIYRKLAETHSENTEYILDWGTAELFAQQYNNAIEAYNMLEKKMGVTEEISLQKEKIYLVQNKFSKAVEEIKKLVDAFPAEVEYLNYLADLYMANNMLGEAKSVYDKVLKLDSANGNVHLSLAEYYRMMGNNSKSFEELENAFSSPAVEIDTKIKILLSYYALTENADSLKKQAYKLCDIIVSTHPEEAKGYSMYGDFLIRDNKITEAREQYLKVISLDSSRYAVWEQLLSIELALKNFSALKNESSRALELFPEQAQLYLMNGVAEYMLKNYDKALAVLNKGTEFAVFDDTILKNLYTYMGDPYHAKQQNKESYQYYDKALAVDSSNAYVLNNYSYYLTLQGESLPKAEKMAAKAVSLEPSNASYLDTYAWVLFGLHRYTEAETYLQKALDAGGDKNPVILEHFGDVQFKLNNKDKALEYWKKAKSEGKASDFLDKKIADETYYE